MSLIREDSYDGSREGEVEARLRLIVGPEDETGC